MLEYMYKRIAKKYIPGKVRKCSTKLKQRLYVRQADSALCHMLCLTGYKPVDMYKRPEEVFSNVTALMNSVKSGLMKGAGFTCADSCEYSSDENDSDRDENMSNQTVAHALSEYERETQSELESMLLANMPKHAYKLTIKLICGLHVDESNTHQSSISYHFVLSKGLPKMHPFESTYKYDLLVQANAISTDDETDVPSEVWTNNSVSLDKATHIGTFCSLKYCIQLLLEKISGALKSVPEVTMEKNVRRCVHSYVHMQSGAQ